MPRVFRHPTTIIALYCSFVRPIFEYAIIVRSPSSDIPSARLESIQRKVIRYVIMLLPWRAGDPRPSNEASCPLLGLQSLATRNQIGLQGFSAMSMSAKLISIPA